MRNKIRELRARFDLTQEELADKAEVTRQTIIAIESGKYGPSLELAFKIARVFKTRVEDVFEYE
ncbi:MAG: helix-turn-helix transcriptional regulator [Candidatus Micrarchaeota archaeon]